MKVDNFVLLMISIITLIIISLVTECNRGRLKELEDKATQEIKETFFVHLGSALPTESGQKGFLITDITEGRYGGRSKQQVINSIGNHNINDYISENEYNSYNSNLFNSPSGTEKNPEDCDLNIGSSTNINMIPYHHVQPNKNYSYGGLNCQDKYGSDYKYGSDSYNLYNIPTIFGVGSNIYNIPNDIELNGTIQKNNEVLDSGNLEMSIESRIHYDSSNSYGDGLISIANKCGLGHALHLTNNQTKQHINNVEVSKEYPITIIYDIKLITDNSIENQYKLEIEVKIQLDYIAEHFIYGSVNICSLLGDGLGDMIEEQNSSAITNFTNHLVALYDNIDDNINAIITNNLQNVLNDDDNNDDDNNDFDIILLYKFTSNTINKNDNNEISFTNFYLYVPSYEALPHDIAITIRVPGSGSSPPPPQNNNYTILISNLDLLNIQGPKISQFKDISKSEIQIIYNNYITDTINTNINHNIESFNLTIENDSDILDNLSLKSILEKLNNQTIPSLT